MCLLWTGRRHLTCDWLHLSDLDFGKRLCRISESQPDLSVVSSSGQCSGWEAAGLGIHPDPASVSTLDAAPHPYLNISCFSWMGPSSLPQRRAVLIGGASIDLVLSRAVYLGASRPFGRKELLGREGPGALLCRVSTCLRVELGGEGKLGLGPAPVVWAGWEPDRGLGVWLEQTPYGWREWLPGAISGIPGLQVLGSD